jgi:hypothetical protein
VLLAAPPLLAQGQSKLPWSTLMGGSQIDVAYAIAVDASGMLTVTGRTESANWPYGQASGTNADVFVARLDPGKSGAAQLVWCRMLDGGGDDMAFDLAMSVDGTRITVVGLTGSPSLPVTANAYQRSLRGPCDAFVLQLDGAGSITYCSYLGGDGFDWANAVEHDAAGRVVLGGVTDSPTFPTTSGAYDTSWNGGTDIFASVLDPRLPASGQLVASTFLGGSGADGVPYARSAPLNMAIGDVAVAADGSILVAGRTRSADFPTTQGAFDRTFRGSAQDSNGDMFVSRFDPTLGALRYSTYIGGSGDEGTMKLAVDAAGDVCVVGYTWSPGIGTMQFPTTVGAPQRTRAGGNDGVVAVLRTEGKGAQDLRYATLLGGSGYEYLAAILIEDSGVLTLVGTSFNAGFPGTEGAWSRLGSPADGLIVRLDPRGNGAADLHYVSYFGGLLGTEETVLGVARSADGRIAVTGGSTAPFPTTTGALQRLPAGSLDVFVATFDPLPANAYRFGASTGGCRGSQSLQVNSNPKPGNATFQVIADGAPPSMPGALVLDAGLQAPPVKLWNVDLFVLPTMVWPALADAAGAWRTPLLALPASWPAPPAVYMQAIWLEPATCSAGPFSASHVLGL